MRLCSFAALLSVLTLTGCSLSPTAPASLQPAAALQGNVHGGQQPVSGSHVYLFAANATGYTKASTSLLNAASTGHSDTVGAYVLTDANGNFSISSDYTCTAGQQVYIYALGGNSGSGTNSAVGELAVLGACPVAGNFAAATPFILVNEVSTIAAAYAIAGFAVDATHVAYSGTALGLTGIQNAFVNAANLATLSTGQALAETPAGTATVPQTLINSLANILAACINSTGPTSSACNSLFTNAKSSGSTGTTATDTATAAINIAHNPGSNVATIFAIPTPSAPFAPALPTSPVPTDFTVSLIFSGGGISNPVAVAIDATGDAWIANQGSYVVTEISPSGTFTSGSTGYSGGGLSDPQVVSIDLNGNAWFANPFGNNVFLFSSIGAPNTNSPFTDSTLNQPNGLAVDASNRLWISNYLGNSLTVYSPSGTYVANYNSGGVNGAFNIAFDASGNIWTANEENNSVSHINGTTGASMAGTNGLTTPNLTYPFALAIDNGGNAWVSGGGALFEWNTAGTLLSPTTGYAQGKVIGYSMLFDGLNNLWICDASNGRIEEVSGTGGALLSPTTGYASAALSSPQYLAIDGSGNLWIANTTNKTVAEIVGIAAPVVTPIAAGAKNGMIATRP